MPLFILSSRCIGSSFQKHTQPRPFCKGTVTPRVIRLASYQRPFRAEPSSLGSHRRYAGLISLALSARQKEASSFKLGDDIHYDATLRKAHWGRPKKPRHFFLRALFRDFGQEDFILTRSHEATKPRS